MSGYVSCPSSGNDSTEKGMLSDPAIIDLLDLEAIPTIARPAKFTRDDWKAYLHNTVIYTHMDYNGHVESCDRHDPQNLVHISANTLVGGRL